MPIQSRRLHLACLVVASVCAVAVTLYYSLLLRPRCTIRKPNPGMLTRVSAALRTTSSRTPPVIRSVHLSEFSYLNWPEACSTEAEPQLLLLGAAISAPSDFHRRRQLRRVYMSQREYSGFQLRWIFILGSLPNASLQALIDEESRDFGDIAQLSFRDSYENLTLKTLAAMDWTVMACPTAKFFLKTDSDCMVNPFRLVDHLAPLSLAESRLLYTGSTRSWLEPNRHSGVKKWRVSYQNYPLVRFAQYAGGAGYILSRTALTMLLEASGAVYPMRLEDVYVGLCALQAGLEPKDFPKRFIVDLQSYSSWCDYRGGLVMHAVLPSEMAGMWAEILAHKDDARAPAECRQGR